MHPSPATLPDLALFPLTTFSPDSSPHDAALVGRMAAGDESALGALYDRFGTIVYSLAIAMLREPADAEEVVSDTFAQLWRSAKTFDATRGAVQAWIVTVARSRALDRLRSRKRAAAASSRLESAHSEDTTRFLSDAAPRPDDVSEAVDLRERVKLSLADLPHPQREVLELAYFHGLSQTEIADRLGEPLGTVKTRARSAMSKLRESLSELRERGAV